MAQVKLMKIDTDGVPVEMNQSADDITLNSYTVDGVNGPVLSGTGLDLMTQNISNSGNIDFNDPAVNTIEQTAGALVVDDVMAKERENTMATTGGIAFPVITDLAGQVDAFRLPALAGAPSASPTNAGEGHLVWDSTGDRIMAWDGAMWVDTSIAANANTVCNTYIADEALLIAEGVYISAADNVSKASATGGGAASRLMGFTAAAAADTANVEVCSEGVLGGFTGLTAGERYYLDTTAGAISTTVPTGAGNTIVQAGYAKSATELHIHIEQLGRRS
jgi:hypothetical protein